MRRLVWLGVIFALLWSGWWYFAAASLQAGLVHWFEERRAEGWQADLAGTQMSGYPLVLETTLDQPALADPQTGVAFEASELGISAPTWWPGYVTIRFPEDEMIFANPEVRHTMQASAAVADLRLHPGTALEVQEMSLTAGPWALASPEGSLLAAQGVTLRMRQDTETPFAYEFTLDAPAFQPGSVPRRVLRIPSDWPLAFDSLALDATVLFDRAFDRTTLEEARPQPRRIDLRLAEAVWGSLLIRTVAALDVSSEGLLNGEVSLQARNWQDILTLAETAGTLPRSMRPQLESVLAALARGSGNPDTIDVTLTLRNGTMFLGFIPLGPAPQLILR